MNTLLGRHVGEGVSVKIDKTTFLLLTSSLATGCQSRGARQATDQSSPGPVAVATILVDPVPNVDTDSEEAPGVESAPPSRCHTLPAEDDCPGEGPRSFCQRYEQNFRPAVAEAALSCLESLNASDPCDRCGLTQCGMTALETAQGPADPACSDVEARCEGMGELCEFYSRGLNDVGRERFRRCLIDDCGLGVRFCLWDPSSTPCTEGGGGFIDFQF
jgi:hypothetical protein